MCYGGSSSGQYIDPRLFFKPEVPQRASRLEDDRKKQTVLSRDRMMRDMMLGGTVKTSPLGIAGMGQGLMGSDPIGGA
jgi:hypothetical protein